MLVCFVLLVTLITDFDFFCGFGFVLCVYFFFEVFFFLICLPVCVLKRKKGHELGGRRDGKDLGKVGRGEKHNQNLLYDKKCFFS